MLDVPRYIHDEGQDTSSKSVVVDWYYKRPDETGRMVLHYCKFCNGVVLYASQNDPALAESGLYDHGQYPFVFDPLFVEEDSPAGFGYIDVMKDCQTAIDKMNHAMDENVLLSAKQRYVLSDTAGVNEEELADFSRDIVHVVGRLNDDSFRPLQTAGLQGNSLSYRSQSRIEELKEISGNRDMTQGGTAGGVTAASAIAALQEAGSKLSRDMLKSAYRAFCKAVLSHHRADAPVLRRAAGVPHRGRKRREPVRALLGAGAAGGARRQRGRRGTGQPGADL